MVILAVVTWGLVVTWELVVTVVTKLWEQWLLVTRAGEKSEVVNLVTMGSVVTRGLMVTRNCSYYGSKWLLGE